MLPLRGRGGRSPGLERAGAVAKLETLLAPYLRCAIGQVQCRVEQIAGNVATIAAGIAEVSAAYAS